MLKNKCCLYVIISIRFFSITICNLLIEFPSCIPFRPIYLHHHHRPRADLYLFISSRPRILEPEVVISKPENNINTEICNTIPQLTIPYCPHRRFYKAPCYSSNSFFVRCTTTSSDVALLIFLAPPSFSKLPTNLVTVTREP